MAADTKKKILNTAEQLFATNGIANTSLRTITQKARVNLASVNYHFGSKDELVVQAPSFFPVHLIGIIKPGSPGTTDPSP